LPLPPTAARVRIPSLTTRPQNPQNPSKKPSTIKTHHQQQEEGIVIKRLDSPWTPNDRSARCPAWVKIKPEYLEAQELDVAIVGALGWCCVCVWGGKRGAAAPCAVCFFGCLQRRAPAP